MKGSRMRTVFFEKDILKILAVKALRPIWPGIVFSSLSPTQYRELPDKPFPGGKWVRVKNRICGICASDLHLLHVRGDLGIAPVAMPGTERIYLGHEILGTVDEVGADVTALKPGDRVILDTLSTCYSQELDNPCKQCRIGNYQLCENAVSGENSAAVGGGWGDSFIAHERQLYRVPDDVSDEDAVLVEPLSVGVRTALKKLPEAGETVLVNGCGIVGLNVIQSVRSMAPDARIIAFARYPQQIEMARILGADEVLSGDDPYQSVSRLTGSILYDGPFDNRMILGGFDVIYDCVGSQHSLKDCLRWTRAGGAVVLAGVSLEVMKVDLTPVWYQEVELIGIMGHGIESWSGRKVHTYGLTCELLADGKLRTDGFITHSFRIGEWKEAVRTASDKRTGVIKAVFDFREDAA